MTGTDRRTHRQTDRQDTFEWTAGKDAWLFGHSRQTNKHTGRVTSPRGYKNCAPGLGWQKRWVVLWFTSPTVSPWTSPREHSTPVREKWKKHSTVYLQKLMHFCKIQQWLSSPSTPLPTTHTATEIEYLSTPNPVTQQVWQLLTDVDFPTLRHVPPLRSPPKRDTVTRSLQYWWRHHNHPSAITQIFPPVPSAMFIHCPALFLDDIYSNMIVIQKSVF